MELDISIGILAYNEAESISQMLQSLFQQSLFREANTSTAIEILVVANGCSDATAKIARTTLEQLVKEVSHPNIQWQVYDIEQPGKSNAWNLYVHKFSNPNASYIFLMDADIEFLKPCTLESMIATLERTPEAWVCIDRPIKDVALKEKKNLIERLSASVSDIPQQGALYICGQLYCSRAAVLRKIWMPKGLAVEDGFLRAMILTNGFTSEGVFERITLAESASHIFKAYTKLQDLLRHEKRLVIGSTTNAFLFDYLWANSNQQYDAGELIKQLNEQDPLWLSKLIQKYLSEKGWWAIPQAFLWRRFQRQRLPKLIRRLPVVVVAFLVDLLVFFQANLTLHKQDVVGYWDK